MESGEGNAKRGCGRWMEESGRGAAVEQLTARGMLSIPAMGAIGYRKMKEEERKHINPRNGGAIGQNGARRLDLRLSIPAMGGNSLQAQRSC